LAGALPEHSSVATDKPRSVKNPKSSRDSEAPRRVTFPCSVRNWWVIDGARRFAIHVDNEILFCAHDGVVTQAFPEKNDIRALWSLSPGFYGYEIHGKGFAILQESGARKRECIPQSGNYDLVGCLPDQRRAVVMQIDNRASKSAFTFHILDYRTGEIRPLWRIQDTVGVQSTRLSIDGKTLMVCTETRRKTELTRWTINVDTGKTQSIRVPSGNVQNFPLGDGSGSIVEVDNRIHLLQPMEPPKDLFPGPGKAWASADCPGSVQWLCIGRLVDSNGDGRVAREDGDRVEVWAYDMSKLVAKRIAATSRENILRGWSKDGRLIVFNRIRTMGEGENHFEGDLVVYSPNDDKTIVTRPLKGYNYVNFIRSVREDQILIRYSKTGVSSVKEGPLYLLELSSDKHWPVTGSGEVVSVGGKAFSITRNPKTKLWLIEVTSSKSSD
jgi:hypothetical protein